MLTGSLAPTHPGSPAPLPTLTLTAVLAPGEVQAQEELPTGAAPTPLSDPLRFTFPSPAPAPVSAWRPPLYPFKWMMVVAMVLLLLQSVVEFFRTLAALRRPRTE